jgi:hypothetical protein
VGLPLDSNRLAWVATAVVLWVARPGKASQECDVPRADRAANPAARSVYKEAVRILESIEKTKYQHRTQIDEEKGEYYCDCSGFVGYVLNRTVGKDGTGALGDGRNRPLAMHYEQYFANSPTKRDREARWQRIERLADARPGDIIAWRHEVPKPGNTGHVVIVYQRPVLEEDGLVRVVFIDSTSRPMFDDTRPKGTSGIGRATMWFKIDDKDRPVAHIRGARDAEPKTEAISIGRALPVKKATSRRAA